MKLNEIIFAIRSDWVTARLQEEGGVLWVWGASRKLVCIVLHQVLCGGKEWKERAEIRGYRMEGECGNGRASWKLL